MQERSMQERVTYIRRLIREAYQEADPQVEKRASELLCKPDSMPEYLWDELQALKKRLATHI